MREQLSFPLSATQQLFDNNHANFHFPLNNKQDPQSGDERAK
jgi:hypothetical protein